MLHHVPHAHDSAAVLLGMGTVILGNTVTGPGLMAALAACGSFMGGAAALVGVAFTVYRDLRDRRERRRAPK